MASTISISCGRPVVAPASSAASCTRIPQRPPSSASSPSSCSTTVCVNPFSDTCVAFTGPPLTVSRAPSSCSSSPSCSTSISLNPFGTTSAAAFRGPRLTVAKAPCSSSSSCSTTVGLNPFSTASVVAGPRLTVSRAPSGRLVPAERSGFRRLQLVRAESEGAAGDVALGPGPVSPPQQPQPTPVVRKKAKLSAKPTKQRVLLRFLWLEKNIGIALDQVILGHGIIPLSPYFFWPRKDAWEELKAKLDSKRWISRKRTIILLNQATDIINLWQQNATNSL